MAPISDVRNRTLLAGVGGLGAVDIILRSFPELIGLGDSIIIPVLFGLIVDFTLEPGALGSLIGNLMLAIFLASVAPQLFPTAYTNSTTVLPLRLLLGRGSLIISLVTKRIINPQATDPISQPLYDASAFTVSLFTLTLFVFLVLTLSIYSKTDPYNSKFNRLPSLETVGITTLLILGVGVVIGTVSLLYPLPEISAISAGIYIQLPVGQTPGTELTERLVLATKSIWLGMSSAVTFVYAIILLVIVAFYSATTTLPTVSADATGAVNSVIFICIYTFLS